MSGALARETDKDELGGEGVLQVDWDAALS